MKRHHLHVIGASFLLVAVFFSWPSQEQSAPAPLALRTSQRTQASNSPSIRTTPSPVRIETIPFFESPRLHITTNGSIVLKATSFEDLKAALDSVSALPPSTLRDKAIADLLERLAEIDPQFAKQQWLAWENALTEPWLEAASKICLALAKDDPFGPSDFITEHLPRTAQLDAWEPLLWTMDYSAAAKVLPNFPINRQSLRLTKSLSIQWMKADPEACVTWLESLLPTLSQEQRQSLNNSLNVYRTFHPSDPDPFENRLTSFRLAKNPLTRNYLAHLVLDTQNVTSEQRAAFIDELADALPDYHAILTSPDQKELQEFRAQPQKIAATLSPAEYKNLSSQKQSALIDGLTNSNPENAAKFLVKMETSSRLGSVLFDWHEAAPADTLAFTKTISEDPKYQLTLFNFAMTTAHFAQEESTLTLINFIKSPARRKKIRAKLAERKN
ncbi:MAG: hypothetical protein ACSHYF_15200 [Verrucomicrobiaceae bacterium]